MLAGSGADRAARESRGSVGKHLMPKCNRAFRATLGVHSTAGAVTSEPEALPAANVDVSRERTGRRPSTCGLRLRKCNLEGNAPGLREVRLVPRDSSQRRGPGLGFRNPSNGRRFGIFGDRGTELAAGAVLRWPGGSRGELLFVTPHTPMQTGILRKPHLPASR